MEVLLPSRKKKKLQNSRRTWESGAIVTIMLQQFSLRVDYFTRKQTGLFREFKCSYNDHAYYHIFFFYRCCHPLRFLFKKLGLCFPIHTLRAATFVFFFFLLSKRGCLHLFLLLPATLKQHTFTFLVPTKKSLLRTAREQRKTEKLFGELDLKCLKIDNTVLEHCSFYSSLFEIYFHNRY